MNQKERDYLIGKIRSQYTEKEKGSLEELKALDAKVKRPANVFAYTFGAIGALVMGSGMSLVMTELPQSLGIQSPIPLGIMIGLVGMGMAIVNYPIYNRILRARRKRYAARILDLSDRIAKE